MVHLKSIASAGCASRVSVEEVCQAEFCGTRLGDSEKVSGGAFASSSRPYRTGATSRSRSNRDMPFERVSEDISPVNMHPPENLARIAERFGRNE